MKTSRPSESIKINKIKIDKSQIGSADPYRSLKQMDIENQVKEDR